MLFHEFMQMGTPAAIALVGFSFSIGGIVIATIIRNQAERSAARKFELDRIECSARNKMVEHTRTQ